MPDILVRSFASFLLAFQPCFTQPSFASFRALTCAWILCSGRHSLARVIQSGTRSPGISSRHNLRFQGLGIDARTLPPSKTFFEIYAKPPGTKRFSATPDSMRTREKSFNPLQIGSKLPLKCAKRQSRRKDQMISSHCHYQPATIEPQISVRDNLISKLDPQEA